MIGNICPNLVMLASIFYYTNIIVYQQWESLFALHFHFYQESKYVKYNQDTQIFCDDNNNNNHHHHHQLIL